ncbi:hypothetical protein I2I05_18830 [Hymenobacter sp. BT683]|uniref:Uncharacterized protein n=1 Tax=Hymenobacter jeongseonensis TaxID=2791027 RepID=A0ABS0IM63_9BACT|nr:DUF6712 family protein [Hymenobacter jeongseonensis]MBF9239455.1 hypothetical protein [Hymenobacter jeongseonensis]
MLFTTTAELKESLGTLHKNMKFETLLSFVEQAEPKHLAPAVGFELLEKLGLPTAELDADYLALRTRLRASLVHYAVLEAAPFLAVAMGELGLVEQSAGNATPTRQWVYHNFVDAAAEQADQQLDVALMWLDFKAGAGAFPEYVQSEQYQLSRGQLLHSAHELGKYLSIKNSRRAYLALLPFLQRVEELELAPLLGEDRLAALRTALRSGAPSQPDQKLLALVRPALAHLTMAAALPELSVSITGAGIRVLSDNDGIRQRQAASADVVGALSRKALGLATQYLERLRRHLDAESPLAEVRAAELFDNSGKPTFVV